MKEKEGLFVAVALQYLNFFKKNKGRSSAA
jgi:hypothetical protein